MRDDDTDNILFETELEAGVALSTKKYYVRFGIEICRSGCAPTAPLWFVHRYRAEQQPVLIQFPIGPTGDVIGWFPYAVKFQLKHWCRLTCAMSDKLIPLFAASYPHMIAMD